MSSKCSVDRSVVMMLVLCSTQEDCANSARSIRIDHTDYRLGKTLSFKPKWDHNTYMTLPKDFSADL